LSAVAKGRRKTLVLGRKLKAERGADDKVARPGRARGIEKSGIQVHGQDEHLGESLSKGCENQQLVEKVASQNADCATPLSPVPPQPIVQIRDVVAHSLQVIQLIVSDGGLYPIASLLCFLGPRIVGFHQLAGRYLSRG
jgi:hypothetical protein